MTWPQLQAMLQYLREEDTLVVCSMDRPARNLNDLKQRLASGAKKAEFARELGISRETLYQYLREQ